MHRLGLLQSLSLKYSPSQRFRTRTMQSPQGWLGGRKNRWCTFGDTRFQSNSRLRWPGWPITPNSFSSRNVMEAARHGSLYLLSPGWALYNFLQFRDGPEMVSRAQGYGSAQLALGMQTIAGTSPFVKDYLTGLHRRNENCFWS